MRTDIRWTEDELTLEIDKLDVSIAEVSGRSDERSRCVAAYLRQVLRDRRGTLRMLRLHRKSPMH